MTSPKILAPLSAVAETNPLIEAGADELYCGWVLPKWKKSYTLTASVNARHTEDANLKSFSELQRIVDIAHKFNKKVFLAMNSLFYTEEQFPLVLEQVEKAESISVDGIIVSDIGFLLQLREMGIRAEIVVSTCAAVFNHEAMKFYKDLGADRIVFPRHLTIDEIKILSAESKRLGLKTDAFILNTQCPNEGGLCTYLHILDKNQSFGEACELRCRMAYKVKAFSKEHNLRKERTASRRIGLWNNTVANDCGLCALPYFRKFKIDSAKIIGRGHPSAKKIADVKAVKTAMDMLNNGISQEEFVNKMKDRYFNFFNQRCKYRNCFYPSAGSPYS